MTDHERDQAIKEGHRIQSADAYFEARPHISGDQRAERVFCDGFDRGWDAATAPLLAKIAELEAKIAQQAEAQEPVEYQFQDRNGKWRGFLDEQHKLNTIADGTWPIRPLFTRPQPAQHQLCQGERP